MSKRNYGIDLLRLVSMLFICLLHVCGQGGIISHVSRTTALDKYTVAWIIEIGSYCAVNLYAMISGYVGVNSKFKISRPISIWLELIFYTLTITAIFTTALPQFITDTTEVWLNAAFPIMKSQYWYMTAYIGMIVIAPVLSKAVNAASIKTLSFVLLASLIILCLLPAIFNVSIFGLTGGYSTMWLCVMYIFGGYFARIRNSIKISKLILLVIYVVMVVGTYALRLVSVSRFTNFTSPTIVIASIALLLIFSDIKFKENSKVGKAISFVSASALAVYIIHVNPLIWNNYIKNFAVSYVKSSALVMGLQIIGSALVIFVACIAIDMVRRLIFWVIRIKPLMKLIDKLADKISEKTDSFFRKIEKT